MPGKLVAFAVFAAIGRLASGQTGTSFEPARRLITLNVAATDAKGDAVNDLKPADVRVREDGNIQPIVYFRFGGGERPVAPTGPGQFINRPSSPLTVIVLDRWNERLLTSASARHDINEGLRHLKSVDRVYIYFLTHHGDLFPVHPLPVTHAGSRVLSALTPADLVAKLDEASRNVYGLRHSSTKSGLAAANVTLEALDTILRQMASFAGRKSLIWISRDPLGVPWAGYGGPNLSPALDSLSTGAAQSGTAIYTVAEVRDERLVALTGGRSYSRGNAGTAIVQAIADARANYRLAYYAPAGQKDRKEHKIRVETVRKGVHLLTQDRYFAGAPQPDPDEVEETLLNGACRNAFDSGGIGLQVTMSYDRSTEVVRFDIGVDPADILLERRGERHHGSLDVTIASYAEGSMKRPSPPTRWEIDLSPEQFAEAARNGIHRSPILPVSNHAQKIRLLVFDRRLCGLGSVTIPPEPGSE